MEVRSIIFSPQIQTANNQQTGQQVTIVVDPTYRFILKYLPSSFTFSVLIVFEGRANVDDSVKLLLKTPDSSQELVNMVHQFTDDMLNVIPTDDHPLFNLNVQLNNVDISYVGDYILDFYFSFVCFYLCYLIIFYLFCLKIHEFHYNY